MRIVSFKVKPRQLFGAVLALTGIIVIVLTFVSNHNGKPVGAQANVNCSTSGERQKYLSSLGYKTSESETSKEIKIPAKFNKVYKDYNKIQKQQGFNLEKHRGKTATLYTYKISNYKGNDNVVADLIVFDGELIAADLCDPSAEDGFLIALGENGTA